MLPCLLCMASEYIFQIVFFIINFFHTVLLALSMGLQNNLLHSFIYLPKKHFFTCPHQLLSFFLAQTALNEFAKFWKSFSVSAKQHDLQTEYMIFSFCFMSVVYTPTSSKAFISVTNPCINRLKHQSVMTCIGDLIYATHPRSKPCFSLILSFIIIWIRILAYTLAGMLYKLIPL